jgi:hypothetical protein
MVGPSLCVKVAVVSSFLGLKRRAVAWNSPRHFKATLLFNGRDSCAAPRGCSTEELPSPALNPPAIAVKDLSGSNRIQTYFRGLEIVRDFFSSGLSPRVFLLLLQLPFLDHN